MEEAEVEAQVMEEQAALVEEEDIGQKELFQLHQEVLIQSLLALEEQAFLVHQVMM
jgi:hypothetical protein